MPANSASTVTICAIQPAVVWGQPEQTLQRIAALAAEAASQTRLDILLLPEHFNATREEAGSEAQWQAASAFAARLARQRQVNLIAGSLERWRRSDEAFVNTALVLDRQGREVGRYDKRKLFGFERRRGVQPGHGSLVVELDGVNCGILICADLWYPELTRELVGRIDLLLVPAQTAIRPESEPAYARQIWHSMAMTRAQENVIVVAVSDQAAESQAPYRCGGVSTLVDPSAEPDLAAIQRVLPAGRSGFLIAQIDLKRLHAFRAYRHDNGLLPRLQSGFDLGPVR